MTEQWRPIAGWEGYEVSDLGRVRSPTRVVRRADGKTQTIHGRVIAQRLEGTGRRRVQLRKRGRRYYLKVHTLVLEAFRGPRPAGMDGCHADGDPLNNRLDNLRWDTRSANNLDAVRHGTHHLASRTHCIAGHPFSGENLWVYMLNGRPRRHCRACKRQRARAAYCKKRERATNPKESTNE